MKASKGSAFGFGNFYTSDEFLYIRSCALASCISINIRTYIYIYIYIRIYVDEYNII